MRIAVVNEVSASHRNHDILAALDLPGLKVYNVGMSCPEDRPELTYIHTGLMAAALLGTGACDFVVGGCGTGQGFINSAMQYPGVFAGLILDPLDAWLFSQINGGNCVSLALNKGYGWASDINLKYIFQRLFQDESGGGYPPHRRESQRESREMLQTISRLSHRGLMEIVQALDQSIPKQLSKCEAFCTLLAENGGELGDRLAAYLRGLS